MNISNIKYFCTTNGDGFRTAVFVSGCNQRCPGCFNQEAWSFKVGKPLEDYIDRILDSIDESYIDGLSILGGEPLDPNNQSGVSKLIRMFRNRFGNTKDIWLWTGYYLDKIPYTTDKDYILQHIDYIIDGPYIDQYYDINLRYRGSSNQTLYKKDDKNNFVAVEGSC